MRKPLSADSLIRELLPPVLCDIRAGSHPYIILCGDVLEEPDRQLGKKKWRWEKFYSLLQSGEASRPADKSAVQRDSHHLFVSSWSQSP